MTFRCFSVSRCSLRCIETKTATDLGIVRLGTRSEILVGREREGLCYFETTNFYRFLSYGVLCSPVDVQ
jgi:hypothetical protein